MYIKYIFPSFQLWLKFSWTNWSYTFSCFVIFLKLLITSYMHKDLEYYKAVIKLPRIPIIINNGCFTSFVPVFSTIMTWTIRTISQMLLFYFVLLRPCHEPLLTITQNSRVYTTHTRNENGWGWAKNISFLISIRYLQIFALKCNIIQKICEDNLGTFWKYILYFLILSMARC